jgi:hypothetical protein
MTSRFFAIGTLAVLTTMAAAAAVSSLRHSHLRPRVLPGSAHLHAFGSRSPQQRHSAAGAKYDAALADLARHASLARPDHALQDLRALAPAVHFRQSAADAAPLVLIDAVTRGDAAQLKSALVALGLQHAAVYSNDVSGWLPVTQLDAATARAEVHGIRAALSRTRSGAVTSQGDYVQRSDLMRSDNSLTGAGVTVGVISDSYDCYSVFAANGVAAAGNAGYASNGFLATASSDVSSGDLPASVNVLAEAPCMSGSHYNGYPTQLPFGDEGRAMLQVVHDVAPGAGLAFYTAENGEADFAAGIGKLAAAGARVIADDVGYFDEPFYQDGIVAQAIDAVNAQGVAYFSAAGNDGALAYENLTPQFAATPVSGNGPNAGEKLLNFDPTGVTTVTALPVTIASLIPGQYVPIVVEWDQPYVTGAPNSGGATSHIDVCITGATGTDAITDLNGNPVNCTGANASGVDPVQIMLIGIPATAAGNSATEDVTITVGLADGTLPPGRIKIAVEDNGSGSTINAFPSNSAGATLQGHPGAAGAAAVGAAFFFDTPDCGLTPATLESYSSEGGAPILFDTAGTRRATPLVRQKPDFVGPDGGNDTFLGFTLASAGVTAGKLNTSNSNCQNDPSYPNFFGTSAATPHVAGIAAMMLEANPAVTPAQIFQALRDSALPVGLRNSATMASPSPNFDSGYGFVQADAAFALMPQVAPAAPVLTLTAGSVVAGGSTTLSWSSVNTTGCTASGSWSGALASNGTQSVTGASAGTDTYTLSCANATGTSPPTSANLTVTAAASGGHGGGALDTLTLWGLAGLGLARLLGCRRRVLI